MSLACAINPPSTPPTTSFWPFCFNIGLSPSVQYPAEQGLSAYPSLRHARGGGKPVLVLSGGDGDGVVCLLRGKPPEGFPMPIALFSAGLVWLDVLVWQTRRKSRVGDRARSGVRGWFARVVMGGLLILTSGSDGMGVLFSLISCRVRWACRFVWLVVFVLPLSWDYTTKPPPLPPPCAARFTAAIMQACGYEGGSRTLRGRENLAAAWASAPQRNTLRPARRRSPG